MSLMRRARTIVPLLLLMATPALAQTATPSPQPTSEAQATFAALPTYSGALLGDLPTSTPFPTAAWPTLTPSGLTAVPWAGVGREAMTPGGAYDPPEPPAFDSPDAFYEDTANGFQGINDGNIAQFMVFLVDVAISFYQWFVVNFPRVMLGARWLVIILIVLYGIFIIWRGSKFAPPDQESHDEQYDRYAFFRTFRQQGRYYANTRRRREKASEKNKRL